MKQLLTMRNFRVDFTFSILLLVVVYCIRKGNKNFIDTFVFDFVCLKNQYYADDKDISVFSDV